MVGSAKRKRERQHRCSAARDDKVISSAASKVGAQAHQQHSTTVSAAGSSIFGTTFISNSRLVSKCGAILLPILLSCLLFKFLPLPVAAFFGPLWTEENLENFEPKEDGTEDKPFKFTKDTLVFTKVKEEVKTAFWEQQKHPLEKGGHSHDHSGGHEGCLHGDDGHDHDHHNLHEHSHDHAHDGHRAGSGVTPSSSSSFLKTAGGGEEEVENAENTDDFSVIDGVRI
ncbi:unnamed protein product, partial [Amoebophrya sp. A120]|eukprot:GSA120T00019859001.1